MASRDAVDPRSAVDYSVELPKGYVYSNCIESTVEGVTCIRANVTSSVEWQSWLTNFEEATSQKFIVKRTYSEPVR